MTAGLETFAKVRALYDRTTNPGEKAAAAGRMEALARRLGMTVAEALSKLDAAAAQPVPGFDWSAFAEAYWKSEKAPASDAPCRRRGLPIYDPEKVECWRDVAEHCWQLDWVPVAPASLPPPLAPSAGRRPPFIASSPRPTPHDAL